MWRDTAWGGTKSCWLSHMCASIIHKHTQTQWSPNSSACKINLNSTRVFNWSPVAEFWFRGDRRRALGVQSRRKTLGGGRGGGG